MTAKRINRPVERWEKQKAIKRREWQKDRENRRRKKLTTIDEW